MNKRIIFMGATIISFMSIFASTFDTSGFTWAWTGSEIVPQILGISALIFGILWFREFKNRAAETEAN